MTDIETGIKFLATLAGVNTSARPISFDIDGAAKISLETPETEQYSVLPLLALKRSVLEITVRVVGPAPEKPKRGKKQNVVVEDKEPEANA